MKYAHVMSKVLNQPLLMEASALTTFMSVLADRAGIESIDVDGDTLDRSQMADLMAESRERKRKPYMVHGSVAVVPIVGTIVQKSGTIKPYSGMTGTDGIEANIWMALEDPDVESILLDIDSPGGSVAGTFDLSDMIYEANEIKPVIAYAGELAASAAYAIASAASKVYLPRTGGVGSIGVLTVHQSIEGALKEKGVKITIISAGDHKVDGNPYEDLPDDVRDSIQVKIDETRNLFAGSVARYRGMDVKTVLATEARMYTGQKAVEAGLADGVMTFNEVLNLMQDMNMENDQIEQIAVEDERIALETEVITLADNAEHSDLDYAIAHEEYVDPRADAVTVIEMCNEAGFSQLASDFIVSGASITDVTSFLERADQINSLCVAAGVDATDIIANINDPVELARVLLKQEETEIDSSHLAEMLPEQKPAMSSAEIWAKRHAQTAV